MEDRPQPAGNESATAQGASGSAAVSAMDSGFVSASTSRLSGDAIPRGETSNDNNEAPSRIIRVTQQGISLRIKSRHKRQCSGPIMNWSIKCPKCSENPEFDDIKAFMRHFLAKHAKRDKDHEVIWQCFICYSVFSTKSARQCFVNHVKTTSCFNRKVDCLYECLICREKFKRKFHVYEHVRRAHDHLLEREDGDSEDEDNRAKKHGKRNDGPVKGWSFTCCMCLNGPSFTDRCEYIKHFTSEHLDSDKRGVVLKCEICNKTFSSLKAFVEHTKEFYCRSGQVECPYQCTFCQGSFKRVFAVQAHIDKAHPRTMNTGGDRQEGDGQGGDDDLDNDLDDDNFDQPIPSTLIAPASTRNMSPIQSGKKRASSSLSPSIDHGTSTSKIARPSTQPFTSTPKGPPNQNKKKSGSFNSSANSQGGDKGGRFREDDEDNSSDPARKHPVHANDYLIS